MIHNGRVYFKDRYNNVYCYEIENQEDVYYCCNSRLALNTLISMDMYRLEKSYKVKMEEIRL